jgi:hypothetical protein
MILKEIIKNNFFIDVRIWEIKKIIKKSTINSNYSFKKFICTFPPYKKNTKEINNFGSFFFKLKGVSTKLKILNFLNFGLIKSSFLSNSTLTGDFEKIKTKSPISDYTLKYSIEKTLKNKEFLILKNFSSLNHECFGLNSGTIFIQNSGTRRTELPKNYKRTIILSTW